ncbi:MAG: methionyl-tRNA formyltransferase [Micrococcales bacterium]
MKILFAGTTPQAARVLEHLVASSEVVAVLTREDAPFGRKRELTPSAVAVTAGKNDIPVIKANRVDSHINGQIASTGAELGVVIAYGTLLKQQTLDLLSHGWLNLHYSLLPKYRGAAPVQRALFAGEHETGVSVFKLDSGMDTGELYLQVPTVIEPSENTADLLERLTTIGITALDELLPQIAAGTSSLTAQVGEASLAAKLGRDDARVDVTQSAEQIENQVRACNPEPMAWGLIEGEPIRILEARAIAINLDVEPGSVVSENGRVLLSVGSHSLQLITVQPASKKPMSASDWMRGLRAGTKLS